VQEGSCAAGGFAKSGIAVDAAALEDTARRVSAAGVPVVIPDIGDAGDLAYVESLRKRFGPVGTLVNSAAIYSRG